MNDRSDHTGGKSQPYIEDKYRQVLAMAESDPALKKLVNDIAEWGIETYKHHFEIAMVVNWLALDADLFMKKFWSAFHNWREEDRNPDGSSSYFLAKYLLMDYVRQKRGFEQ